MNWHDAALVTARLVGSGVAVVHGILIQRHIVRPLDELSLGDNGCPVPRGGLEHSRDQDDHTSSDRNGGADAGSHNSRRRHLRELRQGWIEMVPGIAAQAIRHPLRLESAWIVKARRMHGEKIGHGRERQVDRRSAGRAGGVGLHVAAALARNFPTRCLALQLDCLSARERSGRIRARCRSCANSRGTGSGL